MQKRLRSYNKKNDGNTINELNDKIQSLTNKNDTPKQENKTFLKIIELMQSGANNDELSIQQQNDEIPWKAVKQKTIRKSVKLMKLIIYTE